MSCLAFDVSQDHQIGLTGRKARIEVLDQDLEENRSVMTWQVAVPTYL